VTPSFRLTPSAREHIDELGDFLAAESLEAAVKVLTALETAFEQPALSPGIGHLREDLTDRPVKFWRVYSHLVVYDPASQPLNIVAVLHGSRDIAQILKDLG
jgi:plasmid stabilization system protein ParE